MSLIAHKPLCAPVMQGLRKHDARAATCEQATQHALPSPRAAYGTGRDRWRFETSTKVLVLRHLLKRIYPTLAIGEPREGRGGALLLFGQGSLPGGKLFSDNLSILGLGAEAPAQRHQRHKPALIVLDAAGHPAIALQLANICPTGRKYEALFSDLNRSLKLST